MTWFKSAADALSAEARAIAAEQPVHNKQPGRIVPGLGEADAVLPEEEAMRRIRACWIREMDAEGISSEFMTLMYRISQEEIAQALGRLDEEPRSKTGTPSSDMASDVG